jgi:flagellar protein FlaG
MNDVDSINSERLISLVNHLLNSKSDAVPSKPDGLSKEEIKNIIQDQMPVQDMDKLVENIRKIIEASDVFNKKVELKINKEINRVIITVIDKNSNEVLREIPCVELQQLAAHLQEAIGVLFDTKV